MESRQVAENRRDCSRNPVVAFELGRREVIRSGVLDGGKRAWLEIAAYTNPLPDWAHLLISGGELRSFCAERSIPDGDIECIIDLVFVQMK